MRGSLRGSRGSRRVRRRHLRLIGNTHRLLLPLKRRRELTLHVSHLCALRLEDLLLLGSDSRRRPVLKKLPVLHLLLLPREHLLLLREHLLLLLMMMMLMMIRMHLLLCERLRGLLRVLLLVRRRGCFVRRPREQGMQNARGVGVV